MKTKNQMNDSLQGRRTFSDYATLVVLAIVIIFSVAKCENNSRKLKESRNEIENLKISYNQERNQLLEIIDSLEQSNIDKNIEILNKVNENENLKLENKKLESELNYYKNIRYTLESKRDSALNKTTVSIRRISREEKAVETLIIDDVFQTDTINIYQKDSIDLEIEITKSNSDTSLVLNKMRINPRNLKENNLSITQKETFTEYLQNPYREKAEKSFVKAVSYGVISAGFYAWSEGIETPKFYDNRDNSEAQKRSNLIFGLRTASAVAGTMSALNVGKTIYFHKKENQFIVYPTNIELKISPVDLTLKYNF